MKLLVAVDLSGATEKILKKVEDVAKTLSAQVWLLHVTVPEPDYVGFDMESEAVRDALAKRFHGEHRQIQEIADRLREAGLDTTALLVQGVTVETILNVASKLDVDMIVVGSHGRGAMYQLLVGSVSEGVLHGSERPILVIPTHERT